MDRVFYWPLDITPQSGTFRLAPLGLVDRSPFSGSVKALNTGQIWTASLTFNPLSIEDAHRVQALLDEIKGPANIIRMHDRVRRAPLELGRATITEKGEPWDDGTYFDDGFGWSEGYSPHLTAPAEKGAASLTMDGLPVSQTVFVRGDVFELNQGFYNVTSDAASDATGAVTVSLQPPLRQGAAAGDALVLDNPRCNMRMVNSSDAVIGLGIRHSEPFTLNLVEDIP